MENKESLIKVLTKHENEEKALETIYNYASCVGAKKEDIEIDVIHKYNGFKEDKLVLVPSLYTDFNSYIDFTILTNEKDDSVIIQLGIIIRNKDLINNQKNGVC